MNHKIALSINNEKLLIILYFSTYTLRFLTNLNIVYSTIAFMIVGLLIVFYDFIKYKKFSKLFLLLITIDAISIINSLVNGNDTVSEAILLYIYQGFGILLYFSFKNLKLTFKLSLLLTIYLLYKAVTTDPTMVSAWQSSIYVTKLIGGNSMSILAIFSCALYILYCQTANKAIGYPIFIIAILISLITGGSGGILSTILLGCGIFLVKERTNKISIIKLIILIFVVVLLLFYFGYFSDLVAFIQDDNSRIWMWSHYWQCSTASLKDIIFGGNVDSITFLAQMKNMHNTFINFHYRYGLVPFIFYCTLVIKSGIFYFKKKNYALLILLIATIIRGMTDEACFGFLSIWIYMWLDSKELERVGE